MEVAVSTRTLRRFGFRSTQHTIWWKRVRGTLHLVRAHDGANKRQDLLGATALPEDTLSANRAWARAVANDPLVAWRGSEAAF